MARRSRRIRRKNRDPLLYSLSLLLMMVVFVAPPVGIYYYCTVLSGMGDLGLFMFIFIMLFVMPFELVGAFLLMPFLAGSLLLEEKGGKV